MCQDVVNCVKTCKRCRKAKGPYNELDVKQWSLVANNPLDLLCLDFTTMDPSRDGKENVPIMMDVFNFTVEVAKPW